VTPTGPRWRPAYVGIGSNLDSPRDQVVRAIEALGQIPDTLLGRTSPLYESAPLDGSEQPDFINAVAALLTRLDAQSLFTSLRQIEAAQGRARDGKQWGPRTLDLDLLVFSGESIDQNDLKIPHPGIAERNFVLLPLCDIAPHLRIPGLGSVSGLAAGVDKNNPRIERLC
jgi:2-amino-4-hydroxy-6-hydroxymethyldihydropteridine diphosphokinase